MKASEFKISRNFDTCKFQSNKYEPSIILHPTERTSRANLMIEVFFNDELAAVIPCEKDYMIANVPVIAAKYREGSNFRDEETDGKSVFQLKLDDDPHLWCITPELVCQFISVLYHGTVAFNVSNAIGFCILSDLLGCSQFFEYGKAWVCENMKSEIVVDAWNCGGWFDESCLDFLKLSSEFDMDQLYNQISKLDVVKFTKFMDSLGDLKRIDAKMWSYLILEWISEQQENVENHMNLILRTSSNLIAEKHKLRYFLKIYNKLGNESLKMRCKEHFFNDVDMAIEKPQLSQHYLRYQLFKQIYIYQRDGTETPPDYCVPGYCVEEDCSRNWSEGCTSFENKTFQNVCLFSEAIDTQIPVLSWKLKIYYVRDYDSSCGDLIEMIGLTLHGSSAISKNNGPGYYWHVRDSVLLTEESEESASHQKSDEKIEPSIPYGSKLNEHDIVEMRYHQHKGELEFLVNEVSQGIAFTKITEQSYMFAVNLQWPTMVEIVE